MRFLDFNPSLDFNVMQAMFLLLLLRPSRAHPIKELRRILKALAKMRHLNLLKEREKIAKCQQRNLKFRSFLGLFNFIMSMARDLKFNEEGI